MELMPEKQPQLAQSAQSGTTAFLQDITSRCHVLRECIKTLQANYPAPRAQAQLAVLQMRLRLLLHIAPPASTSMDSSIATYISLFLIADK